MSHEGTQEPGLPTEKNEQLFRSPWLGLELQGCFRAESFVCRLVLRTLQMSSC